MIKITPLIDTLRLEKISDDIYFSEQYKNYISNSRLGLINPEQNGSPEAFFSGFKPIYSSSLDIGTAIHSLCLQKEYFTIVDTVDKPTGKMGVMADELFKIYNGNIPIDEDIVEIAKKVDYYGGKLSQKRIEEIREKCKDYWIAKKRYLRANRDDQRVSLYLDPKSRETAYNCIKAIENSKNIQDLLHPESIGDEIINFNEIAILLDIKIEMDDIPPFILKLKAKVDNFTFDKLTNTLVCNDIKSLGRIVSEFQLNIDRFHYNREIAFYSWLLSLCIKKFYNVDNFTIKGNYLVVSTIPKYYTKVVPMTKQMFLEGWNEVVTLLKMVCKEIPNHKDFAIWKREDIL